MSQTIGSLINNSKTATERINKEDISKFNTLKDLCAKTGFDTDLFKFFGYRKEGDKNGFQLWAPSSLKGFGFIQTVYNSPGG